MKLANRIIVIIIFVISVVACIFVSIFETNKRMEKEFEQKYSLILDSVYEAVQNELGRPIYTSLTMSNDEFLKEFLLKESEIKESDFEKKASDYLTSLKEATGAQTAFLISDNSKKYYTYEGFNKVVNPEKDEHDVWYSIFVNSRKNYDLDVDVDQVNSDKWTVFVNTRIVDSSGKLLGVCGIGLSMENLQEILKHYEDTYSIKVNFINSDGVVQVDTDAVNIENSCLYDVQYSSEKDGYAYHNKNGEYVVMRFVENLNWYLVIHGEGISIIEKSNLLIIGGAVVVIIVNIIVATILSKNRKNGK